MIITTGFSKGGTSKTTLSVELALAGIYHGYRCVLIDADRQRSASNFGALRERRRTIPRAMHKNAPKLPVVQGESGRALASQIAAFGRSHDLVIVDTPGFFSEDLIRAMKASTLLLMPVAASAYETWPLEVIARSVSEISRANAAIRALVVPMRVDEETAQVEREAVAAVVTRLRVPAIFTAKGSIAYRRVFREAHNLGMSVAERGREGAKARDDILSVWREIEQIGFFTNTLAQRHQNKRTSAYISRSHTQPIPLIAAAE